MIIGCRYLQAGDASAHGIIEAVLREQGLGLRRDEIHHLLHVVSVAAVKGHPKSTKYHGAIDVSL